MRKPGKPVTLPISGITKPVNLAPASGAIPLSRRKLFDKFMKLASFLVLARAVATLAFAVLADSLVTSFYMSRGRVLLTVPMLLYIKTLLLLCICSSLMAMRAFVVSLSWSSIQLHRVICAIEACLSVWTLLALTVDYAFAPYQEADLMGEDEHALYFILLVFTIASIGMIRWHAYRVYHLWKALQRHNELKRRRGKTAASRNGQGTAEAEQVLKILEAIDRVEKRSNLPQLEELTIGETNAQPGGKLSIFVASIHIQITSLYTHISIYQSYAH